MASKPPVKFKSKEEIKTFIDEAWKRWGLSGRDEFAQALGISSSALYGYIFRLEIPEKVHHRMKGSADIVKPPSAETISKKEETASAVDNLSLISLDDLLKEIERRGWRVDLSRMAK